MLPRLADPRITPAYEARRETHDLGNPSSRAVRVTQHVFPMQADHPVPRSPDPLEPPFILQILAAVEPVLLAVVLDDQATSLIHEIESTDASVPIENLMLKHKAPIESVGHEE